MSFNMHVMRKMHIYLELFYYNGLPRDLFEILDRF